MDDTQDAQTPVADVTIVRQQLAHMQTIAQTAPDDPTQWSARLHDLVERQLPELERRLLALLGDEQQTFSGELVHAWRLALHQLRNNLSGMQREEDAAKPLAGALVTERPITSPTAVRLRPCKKCGKPFKTRCPSPSLCANYRRRAALPPPPWTICKRCCLPHGNR
jgi:hypothetical protein